MNPTQEQYKWQLYILRPRQWVLSINIMPNQPVRGQWDYQRKMERPFWSNWANQEKWLFNRFPSFLYKCTLLKTSRAMDQFVLEGKLISVRPVRKVKVDTRSESTETELSIWLSTEIGGIFDRMESTQCKPYTAHKVQGKPCNRFFFPVLTKYNLSDTKLLRRSIYFFLKLN